jgi:hypothetical protein
MNDALVMLDGPETRAAEINAFRDEFLRYAAMQDLSQPCLIGRVVCDDWMTSTTRREAVWETVADAMSEKPDFTHRAMRLLCGYARFGDAQAAALLSDMAEHWAELRCDL